MLFLPPIASRSTTSSTATASAGGNSGSTERGVKSPGAISCLPILTTDARFNPRRRESAKRIPLREAMGLAEGRAAVIYHHNTRFKGGHRNEILCWKHHLPRGTMAYWWRRWSNRTFFIINPDNGMRQRLHEFVDRWGDRGVLV